MLSPSLYLEISLKQSKSTKHLIGFLRHCIKNHVPLMVGWHLMKWPRGIALFSSQESLPSNSGVKGNCCPRWPLSDALIFTSKAIASSTSFSVPNRRPSRPESRSGLSVLVWGLKESLNGSDGHSASCCKWSEGPKSSSELIRTSASKGEWCWWI